MNRREFLQNTAKLGIGFNFSQFTLFSSCGLTPSQTEGPFYPLTFPVDQDADLTWIKDQNQRANGEIIWISGQVLTSDCHPIPDTTVEIWQACSSGRYSHDYDPNPAPVDPYFQYWGYTVTDNQGNYAFKTIKPGGYPVTEDWQRPPHIHFKVTAPQSAPLITQLYFTEEQILNSKDRILQRIPPKDRHLVLTRLQKTPFSPQRHGKFNLFLAQQPTATLKVTPSLES